MLYDVFFPHNVYNLHYFTTVKIYNNRQIVVYSTTHINTNVIQKERLVTNSYKFNL